MIKCTECGYDNEIQRVYCHGCGARLDRSSLVEEAQKPQKVVKPTRSPEAGKAFFRIVRYLVTTIVLAGLVACLVEAARPPAGAPTGKRDIADDIVDAPSLSMDFENATLKPTRFAYTGPQLDAYLKNRVKAPKNPTVPTWAIAFDSIYINLGQGSFRVTKKYSLLGQPVFIGGTYAPILTPKGLIAAPLAGNIGRLSIPGPAFALLSPLVFGDVAKNMREELTGAGKMKSIEVTPKMVIITSGAPK